MSVLSVHAKRAELAQQNPFQQAGSGKAPKTAKTVPLFSHSPADTVTFGGWLKKPSPEFTDKVKKKKWHIATFFMTALAIFSFTAGPGNKIIDHDQRPPAIVQTEEQKWVNEEAVLKLVEEKKVESANYIYDANSGVYDYELTLKDGKKVYFREVPVTGAKEKTVQELLEAQKVTVAEMMRLANDKVIEMPKAETGEYLDYDEAMEMIKKGQIKEVFYINDLRVSTPTYELLLHNGVTVKFERPTDTTQAANFGKALDENKLSPMEKEMPAPEQGGSAFGSIFMFIMIAILITWMIRRVRAARNGGSGGAGGGGGIGGANPAAKKGGYTVDPPKTRFDDVRGYPKVINELKDIVANFNRHRNSNIKTKPISGVMLYGPPGTGKTLMAKAIAGEAGVPFLKADASEFVEMYVGVGARRVRDLFAEARKHPKGAIIFIDEIDAIGRKRGGNDNNSERETTLNQLLIELQGFTEKDNILVMAATNRLETLDDALIRSGRFDMKVPIDLPRRWQQRRDILDVHVKGQPLNKNIDLDAVAKMAKGFSGADLANMVNQAAINATREGREEIGQEDFFEALLRVVIGQKDEDWEDGRALELIAHHEVVGHGLMAILMKMKVFMVAMVPRGNTGGLVMADPDNADGVLPSKREQLKQVLLSAGGRAAEQVQYGEDGITHGASSDIQQIENVFRQMMSTGMLDNQLRNLMSAYEPMGAAEKQMLSDLFDNAVQTSMEMIKTVPPEKRLELVRASLSVGRELIEEDAMNMYNGVLGDSLGDYLDEAEKLVDQFVADPLGKKAEQQRGYALAG